jgi:D-alanyl-D-alanine dipeptidase
MIVPNVILRLKTVKALVGNNKEIIKRGYRIKLFDCYRPLDVQKKDVENCRKSYICSGPQKDLFIIEEGRRYHFVDAAGKNLIWGP